MLAALVCLSGCGDKATDQDAAFSHKKAAALSGLQTVESVEDALGEPISETRLNDGESVLIYPRWRLIFEKGALVRRYRELERGRGPRISAQELDARILALDPGMGVSEVARRVGEPAVVELFYQGGHAPERILRYMSWELRFHDGELRYRSR